MNLNCTICLEITLLEYLSHLLRGMSWSCYHDLTAYRATICDITWALQHLKSPEHRLFVQQQSFTILAYFRGNHQWPVDSPHKGPPVMWKACSHAMTSSWLRKSMYSQQIGQSISHCLTLKCRPISIYMIFQTSTWSTPCLQVQGTVLS